MPRLIEVRTVLCIAIETFEGMVAQKLQKTFRKEGVRTEINVSITNGYKDFATKNLKLARSVH
jgi:hypothetical protein